MIPVYLGSVDRCIQVNAPDWYDALGLFGREDAVTEGSMVAPDGRARAVRHCPRDGVVHEYAGATFEEALSKAFHHVRLIQAHRLIMRQGGGQ